jgi:hypothetical protein
VRDCPPARDPRSAGAPGMRPLPGPVLRAPREPLRRLRREPHLPNPQADLSRVRRASAHALRGVRPGSRGRHRTVLFALRAGDRAMPRVRRADRWAGSQGPRPVRALLPAARRGMRPVRSRPSDRPPRGRRRPRPMRDLLDRPDRHLRELRAGAIVPRRAARPDAMRLVRARPPAAMRPLRPLATPDGAVAGGPDLRQLLPARAGRQSTMPVLR